MGYDESRLKDVPNWWAGLAPPLMIISALFIYMSGMPWWVGYPLWVFSIIFIGCTLDKIIEAFKKARDP